MDPLVSSRAAQVFVIVYGTVSGMPAGPLAPAGHNSRLPGAAARPAEDQVSLLGEDVGVVDDAVDELGVEV